MSGKVHTDPDLGEVFLRKSVRARRVSIRVHPTKGITVTVPFYVPYATGIVFLASKRDWVDAVLRKQASRQSDLPAGEDIESLRKQAKAYLPDRLRMLADRYGFQFNRVAIKHNTSNWGSCSSKGNINLNLNLMRVPVPLRDYILLHELTHLRHPDHSAAFHAELEKHLADHFAQNAENEEFQAFEKAIKASRSRYPIGYTLQRSIKAYRPV